MGHQRVQQAFVGLDHSYTNAQSYQQPLVPQQALPSPHHQTPTASYFPQPSPVHTSPPAQFSHNSTSTYQTPQYNQSLSYPPVSGSYDSQVDSKPTVSQPPQQQLIYQQSYQPSSQPDAERPYQPQSNVSPGSDSYTRYAEPRPGLLQYKIHPQVSYHPSQVSSANISQAGQYNLPTAISRSDFSHSSYSSVQIPMHDMNPDVRYMPQPVLGMSRV
jgi:hypothetical protein